MKPPEIVKSANQGLHSRKNALWFERNGDFNPAWALVILYLLCGLVAAGGAMFVAVLLKSSILALGVLSYLLVVILMLLIGSYNNVKAKMLATSPVVAQAFHATATVSSEPIEPKGEAHAGPEPDRPKPVAADVPSGPPRGD